MQKEIGVMQRHVEGIWKILQHNKTDDFVISTGKMLSVKNLLIK